MKKKGVGTDIFLSVNLKMEDLYKAFSEAGIPSTDENVQKVTEKKNLTRIKNAATRQMWKLIRADIETIEPHGEEPEAGFREFCGKNWEYSWSGEATWYESQVHVDIDGHGSAVLKVVQEDAFRGFLGKRLSENQYISAESIYKIVVKALTEHLDYEYREYAEEDDYYPPVGEDFEFEYIVEHFCEKYGMQATDCEYDGDTSGYERN